jgi:hypothetical protein
LIWFPHLTSPDRRLDMQSVSDGHTLVRHPIPVHFSKIRPPSAPVPDPSRPVQTLSAAGGTLGHTPPLSQALSIKAFWFLYPTAILRKDLGHIFRPPLPHSPTPPPEFKPDPTRAALRCPAHAAGLSVNSEHEPIKRLVEGQGVPRFVRRRIESVVVDLRG